MYSSFRSSNRVWGAIVFSGFAPLFSSSTEEAPEIGEFVCQAMGWGGERCLRGRVVTRQYSPSSRLMVKDDWRAFLGGISSEIDRGGGGGWVEVARSFGLREFLILVSAHLPHLAQWLKERHKAERNTLKRCKTSGLWLH